MQPKFCTISGIELNKTTFGFDEKHHDCISLKLMLLRKISELNLIGITDFISNCQMGIPLWAAEVVLSLRKYNPVRLNIVMPFENQSALWSDEWRERFFTVHEQADSVIMLTSKFYKGCYFDCDRYMIDNSDMLLWVGSEGSHISEYAREHHKSVIMLHNKAMVL